MAAAVLPKGQRAWSYSRLMDYEKCPQLFKFKVVDRLPEPGSAAMDRGSDIHKKGEVFLAATKKGVKVPQEFMRLKQSITLLKKLGAVPEDQWTFTHNFKGTTSWFGKDAWARVKIDAVAELPAEDLGEVADLTAQKVKGKGVWIMDWKTGQFRPEAAVDQLDLYVASAFILRPTASFALASLGYTDIGRSVHSLVVKTSKTVEALKKKWIARVAPLQKDTKFKATPGPACHWCFFHAKKGGPCKFGT